MARRVVAPTEADARNRAVLEIANAVCGYMKGSGTHECRRERAGQGEGCMTVTTWAAMVRRIEDVLEGWEPVNDRSLH